MKLRVFRRAILVVGVLAAAQAIDWSRPAAGAAESKNGFVEHLLGQVPGRVELSVASRDGRRVAIVCGTGDGKQCVSVDGEAGPPYDAVGALSFSPNAQRVAYAA